MVDKAQNSQRGQKQRTRPLESDLGSGGWGSTVLCMNAQRLVVGVNWIQMNQTQCRVLIKVILAAVTTKPPDGNGCNRVEVCMCV